MNDEFEKEFQKKFEERFEKLESSIENLSTQLIKIRENIQKRKRETTTLKILLYTGLFLLLIGFIYSNTTLQRVQLKNLQSDFRTLTKQTNQDLIAIQRIVLNKMQQLKSNLKKTSIKKHNEKTLRDVLSTAFRSVSKVQPLSLNAKKVTESFGKNSNELILAYINYKKKLAPNKPVEKNPKK